MEVFLVYLWMQVNTFIIVSSALLVVSIVGCFILAFVRSDIMRWDDNDGEFELKIIRKLLCIIAILVSFLTFIPSSKSIAYMVATHYGVQLVKSDIGQKVQSVLLKKANDILDEELKEKK